MANYFQSLQGFLGAAKSSVTSALPSSDVDDFADFATAAASPVPPSHSASSVFDAAATSSVPKPNSLFGPYVGLEGRAYTKWYRVWERTTLADFTQELILLPILLLVILISLWGASANKKRAKQWASANLPLLQSEYALVGYGGKRQAKTEDGIPADFWQQKTQSEFSTYCTGRQNVAGLDVKVSLYKRYNPLVWAGESVLSFFFDSFTTPSERLEATAYCFDGKEKSMVPVRGQGASGPSTKDSTYDSFVWAIVHKDKMRQLREDRYDLSLTSTKEHPKLPDWAMIMSESAEVTEAMLTPELIKAVGEAGEDLEALIVTDQPIDAPKKLNDTVTKKRVQLSMKLSPNTPSSLFAYFLRLPDHLVSSAHFRPEALRRVKTTRDDEIRRIRKVDEDEKADERRTAGDKLKKEERDRKLGKLSADEQRKFLEKEKDKEQRKMAKKRTMRA